jgi:regulatory protein YycH of two-component signal transduction system YycFG
MRIDFELVKTVLLVFLVLLSFLLTFGIWSYQGNYEPSTGNSVTDAELNGSEETKKNLVQPSQIVMHDEGSLKGFGDSEDELEVFQKISKWALYDFEIYSKSEDVEIDESSNVIELVFPTSIPSSIISEMFTTDDSMPIDSTFERIYIFADEDQADSKIIFKNRDQDGIDIEASVQNVTEVVEYFNQLIFDYDVITYEKMELADERTVYLPSEVNITGKQYRFETISTENTNFRSIFFRKPSTVVNTEDVEGNEVLKDNQREVVIKGYAMEYTNFSPSENNQEQNASFQEATNTSDFLLSSSIDFINSHKGWLTGQGLQYRLYDLSEISKRVDYRMVLGNYPVFSKGNEGLSLMSVTYKNMSEYNYVRPLMQLTTPYDRGSTDLMSGDELRDYLYSTDRIAFNQITDIRLGYRMEQQGQIFDFIPTWCIKTYAGWEYVTENAKPVTQGGELNAMGAN